MLRLSVVISIKVGGIPPTTRVDNIRNLARRHFAAHGHHFFVGRALLVPVLLLPYVCLNLACDTSLLHFHAPALQRIAIQAGLVESWTGCTKVCRYRNCHCSAASQLSSSQDREDFRWYDETGRPHSVKACVRLQCLCLPCRRLPGSVLGASPRHVRG